MKAPLVLLPVVLLALPAGAEGEKSYRLLPHTPKAGQTVRMHSVSESEGGTMTVNRAGTVEKGSIDISRERIYDRRLTLTGRTPTLEYRIVEDRHTTSISLDGPTTATAKDSPLSGRTLLGYRDDAGHWKMILKEGVATGEQAADLAEIEAYENRSLYLDQAVKIGDTWTINPAFIRYVTERDVGKAEVNATATLKDVVTLDDEPTAVIGVSIQSVGSKQNPLALTESGLAINLAGTMHLSLVTMLDKKLVLEGSFTTQTRRADTSTIINMPYKTTVTKTIVP